MPSFKREMPASAGLEIATELIQDLEQFSATNVSLAGSLRRKCPVIHDIDIVCIGDSLLVNKLSVDIVRLNRSMAGIIYKDIQADIFFAKPEGYGAALLYLTGSKNYNIRMRRHARIMGYKLNQYGLFSLSGRHVAGKTEEEIYKVLKLSYVQPSDRSI